MISSIIIMTVDIVVLSAEAARAEDHEDVLACNSE